MSSFVISDTHFGHTNSWQKFKLPNGDPLRPFTSNEEMDEAMIERWNAKVHPQDTVYHLGDVVIRKASLELVKRLNGKKRLVRGNHDIFHDKHYRDVGFEKMYGVRVFVDKFILSHIPLHPDCVTDRFKVNVHGHLHANEVMRQVPIEQTDEWVSATSRSEIDPRYLCVSVEHTNYEPLSFDEVDSRIAKRWEETGYVGPTSAWGNGSGPN
jgi:calcineurin-like phosphoesterase family protein